MVSRRCAGSEQLVQVEDWNGLPPEAEGAELWHEEGLVLLLAQQREHVLHQLAQPAVTVERRGGGGTMDRWTEVGKKRNLTLLSCFLFGHSRARKHGVAHDDVNRQLRTAPRSFDEVERGRMDTILEHLTGERRIRGTHEDLFPLVCSWISSPLGLTVNIRQSGTPTSL